MKVAVLGCGPAGLLAAHAARLSGHSVTIFSNKVKSVLPGAQYIHEPIPELTGEPVAITYVKKGDRAGYAKKVYGWEGAECSWDLFPEGEVEGYPIRSAYNRLWERFAPGIVGLGIDGEILKWISGRFDKVISTIPAPTLCWGDGCKFTTQRIGVAPRADNLPTSADPVVVYDGRAEVDHYRTSLLFGAASTEYSDHNRNFDRYDLRPGWKPLDTTCMCRPHIVRAGRFGKWSKGVLVHDAFRETLELLS